MITGLPAEEGGGGSAVTLRYLATGDGKGHRVADIYVDIRRNICIYNYVYIICRHNQGGQRCGVFLQPDRTFVKLFRGDQCSIVPNV